MGQRGGAALIRLLIDECLSVDLVAEAFELGLEAHHVNHLGLRGSSDRVLMTHIIGGDFTFVTNNRRDFLKLYRVIDFHAGLLIILPSVGYAQQLRLFRLALEAIMARGGDVTAELVEVSGNGIVTFERYPPLGDNL